MDVQPCGTPPRFRVSVTNERRLALVLPLRRLVWTRRSGEMKMPSVTAQHCPLLHFYQNSDSWSARYQHSYPTTVVERTCGRSRRRHKENACEEMHARASPLLSLFLSCARYRCCVYVRVCAVGIVQGETSLGADDDTLRMPGSQRSPDETVVSARRREK